MKISDFTARPGAALNNHINQVKEGILLKNDQLNFLISSCYRQDTTTGRLAGVCYLAKDNIATKGVVSTGGSQILKDYLPPFDATIISKIQNEGAILLGKTNLDELAVGGTGINPFFGATLNPIDDKRKAGGSSGGSASAVGAGVIPFALGTDTGDSIRKPASYTGTVGFKPTYGLISRYGVFPFACSLDHVGFFTTNVRDCALLTSICAGQDVHDATSAPYPVINYLEQLNPEVTGLKIGVLGAVVKGCDQGVQDLFQKQVDLLKLGGAEVQVIEEGQPYLNCILPAYLIISSGEATSNDSNLTGLTFGNRVAGSDVTETMMNTRSQGFANKIKRRFMIGSYVLEEAQKERYFRRAQQVRRVIVDWYNSLFREFDVIIAPAAPTVAPLLRDVKETLSPEFTAADNYLAIANFAGTPSLTMPMGNLDGLPVGININGAAFDDLKVFNVAAYLEGK